MDIKVFKDKLFDLLNDDEYMDILDIDTDDKNNIFRLKLIDGSMFEIECRQFKAKENGQKKRLSDILAKERKNSALNVLLKSDPAYLYVEKCQAEEDEKLDKLNLNIEQIKQVNRLVTAINQSRMAYGSVAYQLGLQDGIKLSDELRQII